MPSTASAVAAYLSGLADDRRAALEAVRATVLANLDGDYEEGIQYGMIGYYVPHRMYPAGYHAKPTEPLPFAALASQKSHMAVYLMGLYVAGNEPIAAWFERAWKATEKKLDMGKSCVRFRSIDDVPLEVVGEVIKRMPAKDFVAKYDASKPAKKAKPSASKK